MNRPAIDAFNERPAVPTLSAASDSLGVSRQAPQHERRSELRNRSTRSPLQPPPKRCHILRFYSTLPFHSRVSPRRAGPMFRHRDHHFGGRPSAAFAHDCQRPAAGRSPDSRPVGRVHPARIGLSFACPRSFFPPSKTERPVIPPFLCDPTSACVAPHDTLAFEIHRGDRFSPSSRLFEGARDDECPFPAPRQFRRQLGCLSGDWPRFGNSVRNFGVFANISL